MTLSHTSLGLCWAHYPEQALTFPAYTSLPFWKHIYLPHNPLSYEKLIQEKKKKPFTFFQGQKELSQKKVCYRHNRVSDVILFSSTSVLCLWCCWIWIGSRSVAGKHVLQLWNSISLADCTVCWATALFVSEQMNKWCSRPTIRELVFLKQVRALHSLYE